MKQRPINLNPLSIRLPIQALVSLGHRISGVIVFLLVPLLLLSLDASLTTAGSFDYLNTFLDRFHLKWFLWALFAAFLFHLLAGLRHILMDIHIGESKSVSRWTAFAVIVLFVLGFLYALTIGR